MNGSLALAVQNARFLGKRVDGKARLVEKFCVVEGRPAVKYAEQAKDAGNFVLDGMTKKLVDAFSLRVLRIDEALDFIHGAVE